MLGKDNSAALKRFTDKQINAAIKHFQRGGKGLPLLVEATPEQSLPSDVNPRGVLHLNTSKFTNEFLSALRTIYNVDAREKKWKELEMRHHERYEQIMHEVPVVIPDASKPDLVLSPDLQINSPVPRPRA